MKKKSSKIVIILIFLAGLSLLLYPLVANQWNNHRQKQLISNYESVVADKEAAGNIDYAAEMKKAEAYNDALLPSILPDSFAVADASTETDSSYEDSLNIAGDGMMGIVEIPKIAIKLPIYHGTGDEVLQKAAGGSADCHRSSGRKFSPNRWREHTCSYFRAPRIAERITFYRSGSAGDRRSFSDPCAGRNPLLRGGSDPGSRSGRYIRIGSRGWRRSDDAADLYTIWRQYAEIDGSGTQSSVRRTDSGR